MLKTTKRIWFQHIPTQFSLKLWWSLLCQGKQPSNRHTANLQSWGTVPLLRSDSCYLGCLGPKPRGSHRDDLFIHVECQSSTLDLNQKTLPHQSSNPDRLELKRLYDGNRKPVSFKTKSCLISKSINYTDKDPKERKKERKNETPGRESRRMTGPSSPPHPLQKPRGNGLIMWHLRNGKKSLAEGPSSVQISWCPKKY